MRNLSTWGEFLEYEIVLIRHGQSEWNLKNRFTGWVDVGLSPRGGRTLKREGYEFDEAHTSVLKRCIHTLWHVLTELDQDWIPEYKDWRLNERHYGGLQGLDKSEMTAIHGAEQVHSWRRSYSVRPPELGADDARGFTGDSRYDGVKVPKTESLADTYERVVEYWNQVITPSLRTGNKILIVAHGNSLRALVKHLDEVSDDAVSKLNIPTGMPLIYRLSSELKPLEHFYLASGDELDVAIAEVKNQAATSANP